MADQNEAQSAAEQQVVEQSIDNDAGAPFLEQRISDGPIQQRLDAGPVQQVMVGNSMEVYGGPDSPYCSATMGGSCSFDPQSDTPRKCTRCGVTKNAKDGAKEA